MSLIGVLVGPIIGIALISAIPSEEVVKIKRVSGIISFVILSISIILCGLYNVVSISNYQGLYEVSYIPIINLKYKIGVDGIGLVLMVLTTLIMPISLYISWNSIRYSYKEFVIVMFIIEGVLVQVFSVVDMI